MLVRAVMLVSSIMTMAMFLLMLMVIAFAVMMFLVSLSRKGYSEKQDQKSGDTGLYK